MSYKVNPSTMTMRMEFSMTTMSGFADMLTQMFTLLGGANGRRQVVDMTDVKGNYDASLDLSLADILAFVRAARRKEWKFLQPQVRPAEGPEWRPILAAGVRRSRTPSSRWD